MLPDIHLGKGTDISNSRHIDSEVSEEIYDVGGFVAEVKVEDERSYQRTQELINNVHLE